MTKDNNDWLKNRWRPLMAYQYMITCIFDFIIFPIMWAMLQSYENIIPIKPWEPLTLQGAGLYHLAMGAVLGVSAWSRGQEKIAGLDNKILNDSNKPQI